MALILIVCFALFLRIGFFVNVRPYDEQIVQDKILVGDADEYHNLATGILENRSFSNFGAFRTPGYPIFISIIYFLFGIKPWIVLLVQLLLNAGSLTILYFWSKILFDRKIAIMSTMLYAIDPHTIYYSVNLLTETLFVFAFLASIFILTYGLSNRKIFFFLLSGFLFGLTALIRPIAQFSPLVAIVIISIYGGVKWSFKTKAIVSLIFIFVLTIYPWLHRNQLEYKHLSLSYQQGSNLLFWNAAFTESSKTGRPAKQVIAEFKKRAVELGVHEKDNPFYKSDIYNKIAIDYIINNWKYYILRHMKGIINIFINLDTKEICGFLRLETNELPFELFASPSIFKMVVEFFKIKSFHEITIGISIGIFFLIIYSTFLFGSFLMISENTYFPLIMILIIIMYFSILTGVIGYARFKIPIVPFYTVISSKGVFEIFKFVKNNRYRMSI